MKLRLTDLGVKNLAFPPKGQITYWDETTPGFGLRCSTRSKSYVVMYGEQRHLKTLGRYPDTSLQEARRQAKLFLASQAHAPGVSHEVDYWAVVDEYLRDCRSRLRESTLKGYVLYLTNIRLDGPIAQVSQGRILRAIERYTKSPSSQNYAFTTFKVFFNWAVRRQYVASNPLDALKRPHKSVSRDRVLSDDELKTLLDHTRAERGRFNDIVSLLVFTGQRKSEIANLEWAEIARETLNLSPERTKNRREHVVPLGRFSMDLLEQIEGGSRYVFGLPDEDKPFNGWSRAQRRIIEVSGLDHFTLHDLRRTYSTIHARIGTPIHVTERLLNHVSGTISGVAAIYNRHDYLNEMLEAQARYDDFLARLFLR